MVITLPKNLIQIWITPVSAILTRLTVALGSKVTSEEVQNDHQCLFAPLKSDAKMHVIKIAAAKQWATMQNS